jgi:malonyl-CoA O-methyltransferase
MILRLIDDKIRQSFSDAAMQYDVLTGLHKEIGRELLAKAAGGSLKVAETESVDAVLDVGMGTGWFTGRLKNYFPDSCVVGLDAADGMIEAARGRPEDFHVVQADAGRLPFHAGSFELVVSNLAYQWVSDLSRAFTECHRVLKDDGKFYVTMFGYRTFAELFEALAKTREDGNGLAIVRIAGKEEIAAALNKAGFRDTRVEEETIRAHFQDMLALVKWIKDIGANALVSNMFVGRDWLTKANAYYSRTFPDRWGVCATLEVIWVEARK